MTDYKPHIKAYFEKLQKTLAALNLDELDLALKAIEEAYHRDAQIYIFGNGGSAATASHFVCDFNKGISDGKEKKFHFQCLNDNVPSIMAIANDISYNQIFVYQLKGNLRPSDLVIAISGSGNSSNVIEAVKYAKMIGTPIVGVSGYSGGKLRQLADYHMYVQQDDMQITEDVHMAFDHMMMRVFCDNL